MLRATPRVLSATAMYLPGPKLLPDHADEGCSLGYKYIPIEPEGANVVGRSRKTLAPPEEESNPSAGLAGGIQPAPECEERRQKRRLPHINVLSA